MSTLPRLAEPAVAGTFNSLRKLKIAGYEGWMMSAEDKEHIDQAMAHFVSALHPLDTLSLRGAIGKATIDAASRTTAVH